MLVYKLMCTLYKWFKKMLLRSTIVRISQSCIAIALCLTYCVYPATAATAVGKRGAQTAQSDWCKRLARRLPGISTVNCQNSDLVQSGFVSHNGFPILVRDVLPSGSGAHREGKKTAPVRVLLIGGIHGDELTSSAIVFQWLKRMQTSPAQNFEWKVVPVLNPDGVLAPKSTRVNANGVDLNRNFPTPDWEKEAINYWSTVTSKDPRRFPGKAPLSEVESRWVDDAIERFRPQVIISVHAPFGVLDFDGPAVPPRKFGRLLYNRLGVYPGSLGNYSGAHKNIPVITIELPNSQTMPPDAEVQRIWQDMLTWIVRNVAEQMPLPRNRKKAA
jgi:protein MpaA